MLQLVSGENESSGSPDREISIETQAGRDQQAGQQCKAARPRLGSAVFHICGRHGEKRLAKCQVGTPRCPAVRETSQRNVPTFAQNTGMEAAFLSSCGTSSLPGGKPPWFAQSVSPSPCWVRRFKITCGWNPKM